MKVLVCIGGPTASGKTKLALQLALSLNTEIISFDSRQVYKELNIGVAKPDKAELHTVKHYFIDHTSIQEPFNAAKFEKEALILLDQLFEKNDFVVAVGGTGLYINALLNGLDDIPDIKKDSDNYIDEQFNNEGIKWLQQYIVREDHTYSLIADMNNPMRLLRAAKVIHSTGNKYSDYRVGEPKPRDFTALKYYLNPDREVLYNAINERVDEMMLAGLLNEVEFLKDHRALKPLMTVGYSELFGYFDDQINLEAAVDKIKQNTRRYAKRQFTWFRNQGNWKPLDPDTLNNNIEQVKKDIHDLEIHANCRSIK